MTMRTDGCVAMSLRALRYGGMRIVTGSHSPTRSGRCPHGASARCRYNTQVMTKTPTCWHRRWPVSNSLTALCDRPTTSFSMRSERYLPGPKGPGLRKLPEGRVLRRLQFSVGVLALVLLGAPLWAGQGDYDPRRKPRQDISAALT